MIWKQSFLTLDLLRSAAARLVHQMELGLPRAGCSL